MSFYAPNNHLTKERETVLGWTIQQLADFGKARNIPLSTKTIGRVESGKGAFTRITFTRILHVVNAARAKENMPPLEERNLFPALDPKSPGRA
jgi:hypothetical protein